MRSRRRRQVHLRHRGRPNRAGYRRFRQLANVQSRLMFRWEPIDWGAIGRIDAEFKYLTDMNAREILSAFMMSPDELPGWSYLGASSRIGDTVLVSPPLRQSEDPGYEIPVLRYYGEI